MKSFLQRALPLLVATSISVLSVSGTVAGQDEPLVLQLEEILEPGTIPGVTTGAIPYVFRVRGVRLNDAFPDGLRQSGALDLPLDSRGFARSPDQQVIIVLISADARPGERMFGLNLPDGSRLESTFFVVGEETPGGSDQGEVIVDREPATAPLEVQPASPDATILGEALDADAPRPFPRAIGEIGSDRFTIHNMGTRYGLALSDWELIPMVGYRLAPGAEASNLERLRILFRKYAGPRTLEIFFFDTPQGFPQTVPEAVCQLCDQSRRVEFHGERSGQHYKLYYALPSAYVPRLPADPSLGRRVQVSMVNNKISDFLRLTLNRLSQEQFERGLFHHTWSLLGVPNFETAPQIEELQAAGNPGMLLLKW